MNQAYPSHLFLITFTLVISLIVMQACKDSTSVQNSPPNIDNQTSNTGTSDFAISQSDTSSIIEGEYIIRFQNQFENRISEQVAQQVDQLRSEILSVHNIRKDSVLSQYRHAIKGFAAKLTKEQVGALRQDARIAKVTPNVLLKLGINSKEAKVKTTRSSSSSSLLNSQTIPWGVQRVGGANDGAGATAWILDTGIDLDHPDLNVDVANSASFIANEPADDGNGHGTHISGTIAAIDNNEDVVGVAAGATVVAVKVCFDEAPQGDDQCPANSIINGIDYISNNAQSEDIVNISIAAEETPENENALEDLEDAIINAANNGFQFTLIAGNAGDNANDYSPGRVEHPNVWTASAYDDTDTFASFSNYGNPPIEYGGPGVDVSSLNIGGGVTTMSGTSMAAPHIAGLLLAAPQDIIADGTVSGDPDGNSDPIAFNPPPPSVTISGPGSLLDGQQGTWSASVEYGSGSYSYQWYYKNPGSANWFPGGSSSSFSQTFHNTSSTTVPAYVKVEATNGSQQLDDEYTVLISGSSGGDCPPGHICS